MLSVEDLELEKAAQELRLLDGEGSCRLHAECLRIGRRRPDPLGGGRIVVRTSNTVH